MTSRLRSLLIVGCALVAALYAPENLALLHAPVRASEASEAFAAQAEPSELIAVHAPAPAPPPALAPDAPADSFEARPAPDEPEANLVHVVRRRPAVASTLR